MNTSFNAWSNLDYLLTWDSQRCSGKDITTTIKPQTPGSCSKYPVDSWDPRCAPDPRYSQGDLEGRRYGFWHWNFYVCRDQTTWIVHAQCCALININLKLQSCAKASFSLLLILLGYKWEALTCRMWLSWRVSITRCNLLSDIRVTLWLDYPLIIRDSFYPESPLCRDYPRCHDLTLVSISQSDASIGAPLTN